MDYPTFGGDEGKLQLCVQSLDRKGEVNQGNDRLRVLINRAPKRHRSITALNFFAIPQNAEVPPVPPMPMPVASKRPLPRFLSVFEPLNDCETAALSNVSTPSTSKSSLPVTPASPPHRELSNEVGHHQSRSYFPSITVQQKAQGDTLMDNSRAHPQQYHGFAEILPSDENKEADLLESQHYTPTFETARTDRSSQWGAMRGQHEGNMLMMDGTFGRA